MPNSLHVSLFDQDGEELIGVFIDTYGAEVTIGDTSVYITKEKLAKYLRTVLELLDFTDAYLEA